MNILIVSHGIPSENDPQWGCFELDQARALKKMGHNVIISAIDGRYRKEKRKIGITEGSIDGIPTYLIYWLPMAIFHFERIRRHVRQVMMKRLLQHIECFHGKPDLIYAHYLFNMYDLGKVHRKNPSIPIVGIEHWSRLNQPTLPKTLAICGNTAYNMVDRLLAVSESLKKHIKRHFNKDAEVVYDMLGEEFVDASVTKKKIENVFRFVSVGSIIHRKGFDLLIEAFSKSGLAEQGCILSIIGDGEERERLQKQIDECGLIEKITLVGRKNKQEIIELMKESHAFVLASRAETFGVVYIEAMSQGLPVIATDCGGPDEFVNKENGLLIPIEDVDALTKALKTMYNNYDCYNPETIIEECNRRFAPQSIARQLEGIFEEEIEKKKQRV